MAGICSRQQAPLNIASERRLMSSADRHGPEQIGGSGPLRLVFLLTVTTVVTTWPTSG